MLSCHTLPINHLQLHPLTHIVSKLNSVHNAFSLPLHLRIWNHTHTYTRLHITAHTYTTPSTVSHRASLIFSHSCSHCLTLILMVRVPVFLQSLGVCVCVGADTVLHFTPTRSGSDWFGFSGTLIPLPRFLIRNGEENNIPLWLLYYLGVHTLLGIQCCYICILYIYSRICF